MGEMMNAGVYYGIEDIRYESVPKPEINDDEFLLKVRAVAIPVTILLAIVLPGNKTLPFGDVANLCAFIIGAAVLFRGDIVKTFITGIPIIIVGLYSSTTIGPLFTQLAASVGYEMPAGASAITYFKAGPFIWDVVMAVEGNWLVFVPLTILFAVGFWMIYKFYFKPRNAKAAEAEK